MKYVPRVAGPGPRQSGKTTLLRHAFPQYSFRSLGALGGTCVLRGRSPGVRLEWRDLLRVSYQLFPA